MSSKMGKIIFGVIWLLFCVAAFFTVSDFNSNSSYDYVFYVVIGLFTIIGIGIIIYGLKDPGEEEHEEPVESDIKEKIKEKYPIANKVETAALTIIGVRFLIAGAIAGFAALFEILLFIFKLSDNRKMGDMMFDIVGMVMFSFASIVFIIGGIKKIKLSKNNKNDDNNM